MNERFKKFLQTLIFRPWQRNTNDYIDNLKQELDRVNNQADVAEYLSKNWRSLATGTHRDLIQGELTALEDKEEVIMQHESPNPFEIARLDGEQLAYRRMQSSMELRARTLGLQLQFRPDDDPKRK